MSTVVQTQIQLQEQGLMVQGDLNHNSVASLWQDRKQWLTSSGPVVFDMSQVVQVDSAGLAFLIQLKAELQQAGRDMQLQGMQEQFWAFAKVNGVVELLFP